MILPSQFHVAVAGLTPSDAVIRSAGSILSSATALANILITAGFQINAVSIQPTTPTVKMKAVINLNVADPINAAEAASQQV